MTSKGSGTDVGRSGILLAALASAGRSARYNPVQVQKLLFLIDTEIPDYIGGPHFEFQPYHYGPFDPTVFAIANREADDGRVRVDWRGPYRVYFLTRDGFKEGRDVLRRMPRPASRYVAKASEWVLSQTFRTLVSAIYRQYPDMAVNSRIPEVTQQAQGRWRHRRMHPFLKGMANVIRVPHHGTNSGSSDETAAKRDALALARDWMSVGDDLRFAIEHEHMLRYR